MANAPFIAQPGQQVINITNNIIGGGGGGAALAAGTQTATSGTINFANSNGITFGMSGSSQITASHNGITSQTVQTQGSVAILGSTGAISFNNANGVTFGGNAGTITASHNGLTSQSNQAFSAQGGASTFQTLSFNNANGMTFSNVAGGIQASYTVPNVPAQTVQPGIQSVAVANSTYTTGQVQLGNANGISFGSSAGGIITASHNGLTTARASNDAVGLNTALTGNGVLWTVNSSGLSLSVPAFLTTAALSGHSHGNPTLALTNLSGTTASNSAGLTISLSAGALVGGGGAAISAGANSQSTGTVNFANSNGVTFGLDALGVLTASHNGLTTQLAQAVSAGNGSSTFQTLSFNNGGGVSWSTVAGGVQASVQTNYLTTARASNDAVGLNTALTGNGVAWTVNSSGISLSVPAFLTTAAASDHSHGNPTLALTNLSGTTASASNGFTISLSAAAAGGGGAINVTAGTTSGNLQTIHFSNANGVSFGLNGSTLTASAAGGGGGGVTIGGAELFPLDAATVFSTLGQNSIYFQKFIAQNNISFNNFERRASLSTASSSVSAVAAHTYDYALYSKQTGASSTQYSQVASSRMVIQASYSSNLSAGYTVSQGAASFTATSNGTVLFSALSGFKHLYMPFTNTITAGGEYAVALRMSSATTGNTGPIRLGMLDITCNTNLSVGRIDVNSGISISAASRVGDFDQGVYSATSSNLPATIALSGFTNAISQARMYLQFKV